MTRRELRAAKQKILAQEQLQQFYKSHLSWIREGIRYLEEEIKPLNQEIENFFLLGKSDIHNNPFQMPFSSTRHILFKILKKDKFFRGNKSFLESMRLTDRVHQRQWFRNRIVFEMLSSSIREQLRMLNRNHHLERLCRIKGNVGKISKFFLESRKRELMDIIQEYEHILKGVKQYICINDIEEHLKRGQDHMVHMKYRLDKFREDVLSALESDQERTVIGILPYKIEVNSHDLEMPGWNLTTKAKRPC